MNWAEFETPDGAFYVRLDQVVALSTPFDHTRFDGKVRELHVAGIAAGPLLITDTATNVSKAYAAMDTTHDWLIRAVRDAALLTR